MRMGKLTRLATALALGALMLAGCDDDSNIVTNSGVTSTPRSAAVAPKAAITAPVTTNESESSLSSSFKDVSGPVLLDRTDAQVIQTLPIFNHPQSCTASADGKFLFVTNSGMIVSSVQGPSVEYYKGAISKLEIDADGRLKVVKLKFVDGLHAPMGISVLPKGTGKFPAGSLFVSTGMTAGLDDKGEHITDIQKFNPGVSIFDPNTGGQLGFIPMGPGRAVPKSISSRYTVLAPSGLCFDSASDLYVADAGNTGKDLEPPVIGRPGILRIRHQFIDMYADNKTNEKDRSSAVAFTSERHEPAAVFYCKIDDFIYWTTSDGKPPLVGGVYRVSRENFSVRTPENILGGVEGALMGVTITTNENLVASQIDGQLKYMISGQKVQGEVPFEDSGLFSSPGDIKLIPSSKGYNVLYVPEQEPNSVEQWKQRLRVVVLPKGM